MHLDQLFYLIDISKTNSISMTAKRMFSSQQAVSDSIKRLETELNCTILNRSKTGVELTDDGKFVLSCAIRIAEQYDILTSHFQNQEMTPHLTGTLTIGVAPLATNTLLAKLLLTMHHYHPSIVLYAQEHTMETIFHLLYTNELDFGILGFMEKEPTTIQQIQTQSPIPIHFQELYKDRLVCVLFKNNPLSMQKGLTFHEITQHKYTMYSYSEMVFPGGLCLHISNNTEIHQKFMKEENTICLMPEQAAKLLYPKKDFRTLPITDAVPVIMYLIYRESTPLSANILYQTFIDITLSLVHSM